MPEDAVSVSPRDALGSLRRPGGILAPAALAAHRHLLDACGRMNLRAEPQSSVLSAIKLYDGAGRYLFSWIINPHHLLFYIRKPALKLVPALKARAQAALIGVKVNPAGEVTIRVETAAQAEALAGWLFDPDTWGSLAQQAMPAQLADR